MPSLAVTEELERVRAWPIEWQLELAEELNALTWRSQWDALCRRIHERARRDPISDSEVDEVVRDVRRERPLHRKFLQRLAATP